MLSVRLSCHVAILLLLLELVMVLHEAVVLLLVPLLVEVQLFGLRLKRF